uniref:Uncharacterized protein n=1 Tax=Trichobilharzia regenti TaxID=157069 RepID=A0AA85J887_TRIRE|nr:unnamed protein product [Trichobilharzia regenti]
MLPMSFHCLTRRPVFADIDLGRKNSQWWSDENTESFHEIFDSVLFKPASHVERGVDWVASWLGCPRDGKNNGKLETVSATTGYLFSMVQMQSLSVIPDIYR